MSTAKVMDGVASSAHRTKFAVCLGRIQKPTTKNFGTHYKVRQLTRHNSHAELTQALCDAPQAPSAPAASEDEPMINLAWGVEDIIKHTCRLPADEFQLPNMEMLLKKCGGSFTSGTVASIGIQMADRMEMIHTNKIVHRDINPGNLTIGPEKWGVDRKDESGTIFLVDHGTARLFSASPHDGAASTSWVADRHFMSVNAHKGKQPTPWDDVESVAYVLLYLLRGSLPWQEVRQSSTVVEMAEISIMKEIARPGELCDRDFPQFGWLLRYARTRPTKSPDYEYLRKLFDQVLIQVNEYRGGVWDWEEEEF